VQVDFLELVKKEGIAKGETVEVLARLMEYVFNGKDLPASEMQKWKQLNVLNEEGKLIVNEEDDVTSIIFWALCGLVWKGFVEVRWSK